jgi:hypothetical protein
MNLFSQHTLKKFLTKHNFLSDPYPPYLPDLILGDLYTVPKQNSIKNGKRFLEMPEIV